MSVFRHKTRHINFNFEPYLNLLLPSKWNGMEFDSLFWQYLAEGNRHILFKYVGPMSKHSNKVLRLTKYGKIGTDGPIADETKFFDQVLSSFLPSHCRSPSMESCRVTWGFYSELLRSSEGTRPDERKALYSLEHFVSWSEAKKGDETDHLFAILEYDLTTQVLRSSISSSAAVYSIELKLKCGFNSISPFVSAHFAPLKAQINRFQLLQLAKFAKKIIKSSGGTGESKGLSASASLSAYDPRQLMSGTVHGIKTSLQELLRCPRNNLRVHVGGRLVYGWGVDAAVGGLEAALGCGVGWWTQVLCDIIATERAVFASIEELQLLDVLDVEGAAVAMDRLIELMDDGSLVTANEQLTCHMLDSLPPREVLREVLEYIHKIRIPDNYRNDSSVQDTGDDDVKGERDVMDLESSACDLGWRLPRLLIQCSLLRRCEDSLRRRITSNKTHCSLSADVPCLCPQCQDLSAKTARWVDSLSMVDCLALLQAWLIALTMKDVSVIITFQHCSGAGSAQAKGETVVKLRPDGEGEEEGERVRVADEEGDHEEEEVEVRDISTPWMLIRSQSDVSSGILRHSRHGDILYSLQVIDIEPKPVDKIRSKQGEEETMNLLALSAYDKLKEQLRPI